MGMEDKQTIALRKGDAIHFVTHLNRQRCSRCHVIATKILGQISYTGEKKEEITHEIVDYPSPKKEVRCSNYLYHTPGQTCSECGEYLRGDTMG